MRPIGTSLWQRWPEFGIGLRKQKDKEGQPLKLDHWRGQRDEREWPLELARGAVNGWAWSAAWEKGQPAWMTEARKQLRSAS
jgi:replicative DNA helicase